MYASADSTTPGKGADRCLPGAGEQGMLLLEALVGLAIIGLVAVALLAATGAQVRSADQAAVLLTAQALAHDRMSAFQLLDHDDLVRPPDSLMAGVFAPPFDQFAWRADVEVAEGEYDLFAVQVEVFGRGRIYPLQTLLHRPPMMGAMAAAGALAGGGGIGGMGGRLRGEGIGERGGIGRMGSGITPPGRAGRGGRDTGTGRGGTGTGTGRGGTGTGTGIPPGGPGSIRPPGETP